VRLPLRSKVCLFLVAPALVLAALIWFPHGPVGLVLLAGAIAAGMLGFYNI